MHYWFMKLVKLKKIHETGQFSGQNLAVKIHGFRSPCKIRLSTGPQPSRLKGNPQGDPGSVTWLPPVTPDRPKTGNGNRTSPSYRKTPIPAHERMALRVLGGYACTSRADQRE